SAARLHDVLVQAWPRLAGRGEVVARGMDDPGGEISRAGVAGSSHACGGLTDLVLERALAARARVAVLPCCHDLAVCDRGELDGWLDGPLAIDVMRAVRLRQQGYQVWTRSIPADITPKNRLFMGSPRQSAEPAAVQTVLDPAQRA